MYEPHGMSPDTMKILTGYGHKFSAHAGNIASATGIMIDEKGNRISGIDSRCDGEAIGY